MRILMRGLIGLLGLLGLLLAARFWMDPVKVGGMLGLQPLGLLGLATIRADVAGFFAAVGLVSLAAALRQDRRLLTAPLLMVALAISGRLLTAALGGLPQATIGPIVIEAVLLVVLAFGRRFMAARG